MYAIMYREPSKKKPPWRSLGFTVDFGVRKLESRWSPKLAQVISDFFMAHDRGSLLYDLNQLLRLGAERL